MSGVVKSNESRRNQFGLEGLGTERELEMRQAAEKRLMLEQ